MVVVKLPDIMSGFTAPKENLDNQGKIGKI